MCDFKIKLAERIIMIHAIYESTRDYCYDYLASSDDNRVIDIDIEIKQEDIDFEQEKSKKGDIELDNPVEKFSREYLETLAVYRKIAEQILKFDVLLMHGSAIAVDGKCYIFIAPSGTGKSTHTKLWRDYFKNRAVMINDDKPLIHVSENGVTAYGTPWNGKHGLGSNISAPVKAICILERGENNEIKKINPEETGVMLLKQIYRPTTESEMLKTMELIDNISNTVDVYKMKMNNFKKDAVNVSYNGMNDDCRTMEKDRIEKYLNEHRVILQTTVGYSMEPMLHDRRSLVRIEKVNGTLNKYDVALFHRPDGNYVLHRVLKAKKDYYIIRGDNCNFNEKVPYDWVIGVLTAFSSNGGEMIPVSNEKYMEYVKSHCRTYPIQDLVRLPKRCVRKMMKIISGKN